MWKKDYIAIYVDGNNHDMLERPWGICQLCRYLIKTQNYRILYKYL